MKLVSKQGNNHAEYAISLRTTIRKVINYNSGKVGEAQVLNGKQQQDLDTANLITITPHDFWTKFCELYKLTITIAQPKCFCPASHCLKLLHATRSLVMMQMERATKPTNQSKDGSPLENTTESNNYVGGIELVGQAGFSCWKVKSHNRFL